MSNTPSITSSNTALIKVKIAECDDHLSTTEGLYCRYIGEGFDSVASAVKAGVAMDKAQAWAARADRRKWVKARLGLIVELEECRLDLSEEDICRIWASMALDEEVKASDRLRASELLAKSKGMFGSSEPVDFSAVSRIGGTAWEEVIVMARRRLVSQRPGASGASSDA